MKNFSKYLLIILLVVAGIIRLLNLDFLTLWIDEYVHVMRAKEFLNSGGPFFTNDNNGILLTMLMVPLYAIGDASAFLGRLPSVLFGIGAVYMIFKLGKSLFNDRVGIIASTILTFSLYHVFWSRISRNYAIFMFFVLVVLYLFNKFYSSFSSSDKKTKIKHGAYLFLSFVAAFLSHQLSFLLIFGYAFFNIGMYIQLKYIEKSEVVHKKWNNHLLLVIPSVLLFALVFLPFLGDLVKPVLLLFLPENVASWVIPDWDYLATLWESKPYFSWDLYLGVINEDLGLLKYLGWIGFILAFFTNKRSAIFIFSFFIPILILISFVFREPVLPRYLIGIYPLFLIAVAVSFDFVLTKISVKLKEAHRPFLVVLIIPLVVFLSGGLRALDLVQSKDHGNVVPKALSHWHFTDWQSPALNIKKALKPGDVVMTTNINATLFYLDLQRNGENVHWFRQMRYDSKQRKYVHRKPKTKADHAQSLEGIQKLFNENDRGWLLADYYFENVMTDPKARQFIIENLDYHFALGNESIKVFSWDKGRKKTTKNGLLIQLGRDKRMIQSQEYRINIPSPNQNIRINVEAEGLDYANELMLVINRKKAIPINPNTGSIYKQSKNHLSRQWFTVDIDKSLLQAGSNSIFFQYNNKLKKEKVKGCVIYNFK